MDKRQLGKRTSLQGVGSIDIEAISKEAFEAACESLSKAGKWSKDQLKALAKKAKNAFGDVKSWTKDTLEKLGDTLSGLSLPDIPKLSVEGSITIVPSTIEKMDNEQAAAFTKDQIKGMPFETRNRFNGEKLQGME